MKLVWWGQFKFRVGQAREWEIGPLKLIIQRLQQEWWLAYERDDVFDETRHEAKVRSAIVPVEEDDYPARERYAFRETDEQLSIMPFLANRPIVIRPVTALSISPGEAVTMFAGILLWVRVAVGDPPRTLKEIPIMQPADTWFGPSTIEGELCYASSTNARLSFENVPVRPHRAVAQVHIHNQAGSTLSVERLSLPVPYLSLFEAPNGRLWTQMMLMTRRRDTGIAELHIETGPPPEARRAKLISDPRQVPSKNMLVRAFGSLFRV